MQKNFRLIPAMLIAAAIGAPAAHAGMVTFDISGADTGTVTFTLSSTMITGVSGTFDGSTILTILPAGSIGGSDNFYFPTAPMLDDGGVSFELSTPDSFGETYVNLYDQGGPMVYGTIQNTVNGGTGVSDFNPDTLAPAGGATTPEPGTVGLTLVGAGMVFGVRKRMQGGSR
jgi:hypothetical protein